jgi:hypothetical protein
MRRYNPEFGEAVTRMLDGLGLSHRKASEATGGNISIAYWSHLKAGVVPSYEIVKVLHDTFGADAREVVAASGYSFSTEQPSLPPGARLIGKGKPLPLGPTLSAGEANGIGDPPYESFSLDDDARNSGADYLITVKGDCLDPFLLDGDTVAVKFQQTARNGQVVVVQVLSDFHGELGDSLTLKFYRTSGPQGRGFYRADGIMAHGASDARIVGVVVKHSPAKVPTFK